MVNVCELLINLVNRNVPKLLTGINQTVCDRMALSYAGLRRQWIAGEEAEPKSVLCHFGNVVSLYGCLRGAGR